MLCVELELLAVFALIGIIILLTVLKPNRDRHNRYAIQQPVEEVCVYVSCLSDDLSATSVEPLSAPYGIVSVPSREIRYVRSKCPHCGK